MFYPVIEDPKSLIAGYSLQNLTPIDRKSPTDWTRIYFANDKNGTQYVVRLSSMDATSERDRILEHAISVKLSDHAIGPRIYESFPAEGMLLMERLQPAVIDPSYVSHIKRLAKLIASLHSIDTGEIPQIPQLANKYLLARNKLEALFNQTNKFPQHEQAFHNWRQLWEQLEGDVQSPVLCHNDIHIRNLLMDKKGALALIDNDHCSLGSGLYDLAASAISFNLSPQSEKVFLEAYGARVTNKLFARYKKLVYLTYACMVFSFIKDYEQIDTRHVMEINPSGGFGKLPIDMPADTRRYIQSASFLRVIGDLAAA